MANDKLTEKQRKARNAYSREWKRKNAKKVKQYNQKCAAKRKNAKKSKKASRKPRPTQAVQRPT